MKTIGTDISLDVCKSEGYMMCIYDENKLFSSDEYYTLLYYTPDYLCNDDEREPIFKDTYTFYQLFQRYNKCKTAIDKFAETNKNVNFDNPTIYDFLNLASDLNMYCGLD